MKEPSLPKDRSTDDPSLSTTDEASLGRALIYRLLATGYRYPEPESIGTLSQQVRGVPEALVAVGYPADSALFEQASKLQLAMWEDATDDLVPEYVALFGHAVRGSCPLYEADDFELDPDEFKQQLAQLDTDGDQIALRKKSLLRARKNPAPRLQDARVKLRGEWIPVWLGRPREFRPTTRMPRFDMTEDQVRAVSAFLWQAAEEKPIPHHEPGDPVRGKELFEARGCRACHSVADEATFAASLSRLAEKANYDYLVEWIRNPLEGAIMPGLRLDEQEARDVATYLTQEKTDAEYPPADYLNDESLYEEGKDLVKHFGCFGCHEIAGMENFSRVGTDLTKEGSKPIERRDFGLFTHEAESDHWYTHKGFLDRKLTDPKVFDQGKTKLDWHENLKMPDFGLADRPEDRRALMTFLLGSVDSQLPEFFYHNPTGPAKDVEEGWWVALKYNCNGCHQIVPGQAPHIHTLPQCPE